MAGTVSINRRKRQRPPRHVEEERPVLQLPLEPPQWRDPPTRGHADIEKDRPSDRGDRGVAVIDFFI